MGAWIDPADAIDCHFSLKTLNSVGASLTQRLCVCVATLRKSVAHPTKGRVPGLPLLAWLLRELCAAANTQMSMLVG